MTKRRPVENWLTTKYPGLYRLDGYDDRWRYRIYDSRTGRTIQPRISGIGIREAKKEMDKAREKARSSRRQRRGRPQTVREYGEEWRADKVHAPGSVASLESDLNLYIYPAFGPNRPIDEVTHRQVSKFVSTLAASGLSIATQGRIDAHARQLFNAAVADEEVTGLDRSPFAREPRIVKGKTHAQLRQGEYVPTMTEAVRMADLAFERKRVDVAAFILWTIGTGMRSGEIRGASAEQIDYPKQTRIYVNQQVQFDKVDGYGDKAIHYYTSPKSQAGKRTVPFPPFVVDALSTLTAWRSPREITLPWIAPYEPVSERTRLILMPGRFGGMMHKGTIGRAVAKIADDAGVSRVGGDGERLGVTPNTLRKVYATMLDEAAGVPRKAIDYVTGHASEGVTLKHYTDVTEPGLIAVRDAVQAAYVAARAEVDKTAESGEKTVSD